MHPESPIPTGIKPGPRKSNITWPVFIGFLLLATIGAEILSHWLESSQAYLLSFFSLLVIVVLSTRAFTKSEIAAVVDITTYFGFYLAQDLLAKVMLRPIAVGIAVFLFIFVRDQLGLNYVWGDAAIDRAAVDKSLSRSILRSLAIAIVVCGLSFLVQWIWNGWLKN
jgi:hypothetical protein